MERTDQHVKVWFWSRTDPHVPADVRGGAATINTGAWVSLSFRETARMYNEL